MPQSCRAPEKNAAAVASGQLGGVARVKTMTAKQRRRRRTPCGESTLGEGEAEEAR